MKLSLIIAGAFLVLVGCTSVTPYQPAGDGYGFTDQKIETGRYRIGFRGNASTPRATVENHLLYRMAEVTLNEGYDYFRVLEQDTECHTSYTQSGRAPCATYHPRRARFPYSTYGYECDTHSTLFETREYEAIAYITMHTGTKPADDVTAFDARAVTRNLASQIVFDPS